ncbi:ERB1 protein, partial [Glaucidium brasilianum]|nr:ERB1 protein [Glaucidium brasilianum]
GYWLANYGSYLTNVTPAWPPYPIWGNYCHKLGGDPGSESDSNGKGIWNNGSVKQLPPGYFLICGDRAWGGVPQYPAGGPCYLGRLTLFVPSIHQIQARNCSRPSLVGLGSDCQDDVELWSRTEIFFASLLTPGIAVTNALVNLEKLACWSIKQFNLTYEIISALLTDVDSVRHAVLQNRAAIDFLLLAQGHGCEDFEGMCCMNLSDHSESVYKALSMLKQNMKHIGHHQGGLDEWFRELFQGWGLSGWLGSLCQELLRLLVFLLVILLIISLCFS